MKTNKKGFTLIELLAVIVILAVIALIAVPQILNILNEARKSASADSAYGILKAAETYAATYMLENNGDSLPDGTTFECSTTTGCVINLTPGITLDSTKYPANSDKRKLAFKGTIPSNGTIKLDANGTASIDKDNVLKINNFYCGQGKVTDNKDLVTCSMTVGDVGAVKTTVAAG